MNIVQNDEKNVPLLNDEISSITATFKNFSYDKPVSDAVVYFWESHTKSYADKESVMATFDLLRKNFELYTCEKYEVRTGYLSRYNYMERPMATLTEEEIKMAIKKGKEEEEEWVGRCVPDLEGFLVKSWKDCISKKENPYFEECKKIVLKQLKDDAVFAEGFEKSVNDFAEKHGTDKSNGWLYVLEETTWVLSLTIIHPNKPVYLVHIGKYNIAIKRLVSNFENLKNTIKLLSPKIRECKFCDNAHFLMNYILNSGVGHSYAIENKDIVNSIITLKKKSSSNSLLKRYENCNNELLYYIVEKLPGHVYWLNRDNVYLGCNGLQARDMGLNLPTDIVGKTNYDFHNVEDATELNRINKIVMETGKDFEGEEPSSTCKHGQYLSHKTPLFDIQGKIVGLLGISIDITDRKKAEALEFENKLQKIKIQSQEKFKEFAERMAHDIISPLQSLEVFMNNCNSLEEKDRSVLRNITKSIKNISRDLLEKHQEQETAAFNLKEQKILVFLALLEAVNQKEQQYAGNDIRFKYSFDPKYRFTFISLDYTSFDRMISNLINNAVESLDEKSGIIEITLDVEGELVKIGINDSGIGMPREMIDKIENNISVGTTKATGHGLGLGQIKDTLYLYNGKMSIESEKNIGTKITITFPKVQCPGWIVDRIILPRGAFVVIHDDESKFCVWENLLKDYSNELTLKFFTKAEEVIEFIDFFEGEKDKIFLISDYDLRNQKSGLMLILETGMQKQSVIVTNIYNDKKMQELIELSGIQMFPKQFLDGVDISVV